VTLGEWQEIHQGILTAIKKHGINSRPLFALIMLFIITVLLQQYTSLSDLVGFELYMLFFTGIFATLCFQCFQRAQFDVQVSEHILRVNEGLLRQRGIKAHFLTAREGDRIVFRLRSAEDDEEEAQEAAARAGVPLQQGGFGAPPSAPYNQPVVIGQPVVQGRRFVDVEVPHGAGGQMSVQTPDGVPLLVNIPANQPPGSVMRVTY
jgi:hypothetical protein